MTERPRCRKDAPEGGDGGTNRVTPEPAPRLSRGPDSKGLRARREIPGGGRPHLCSRGPRGRQGTEWRSPERERRRGRHTEASTALGRRPGAASTHRSPLRRRVRAGSRGSRDGLRQSAGRAVSPRLLWQQPPPPPRSPAPAGPGRALAPPPSALEFLPPPALRLAPAGPPAS